MILATFRRASSALAFVASSRLLILTLNEGVYFVWIEPMLRYSKTSENVDSNFKNKETRGCVVQHVTFAERSFCIYIVLH